MSNLPQSRRVCSIEGCGRPLNAKGYCLAHYRRWRHGKDMNEPIRVHDSSRTCKVEGCEGRYHANGMCQHHNQRVRQGVPVDAPCLKNRPVGTKHLATRGYIIIKTPTGWMPEHRYVMEQALGRPLSSNEVIHHIDGDRTRNDIDNLELWSKWHPTGQRVTDKIAWASEFLGEYGLSVSGQLPLVLESGHG